MLVQTSLKLVLVAVLFVSQEKQKVLVEVKLLLFWKYVKQEMLTIRNMEYIFQYVLMVESYMITKLH